MHFEIETITATRAGYGRELDALVIVKMDVKTWQKIRKAGQLGFLYGVDISNAVGRLGLGIRAYYPTVGDRLRASKGVKTIRLRYSFDADAAKALKIEDGSQVWPRQKPEPKLVVSNAG